MRAQFTILSAVTLLMMLLAVSIATTNAMLRMRRIQEQVLPIPIVNAFDDYPRLLLTSLARACEEAYTALTVDGESLSKSYARAQNVADQVVNEWVRAFIEVHAGYGVRINASVTIDFQWDEGDEWWSKVNGEFSINASALGYQVNKLTRNAGIIIENFELEKVGKKTYHIKLTGISLHEEVGVPLNALKIFVDGKETSWEHYYFGNGRNQYSISVKKIKNYVEMYLEYNGLIVRVYWRA